jgi:uncharacterized protein DUF5640
MTRRIQHLAILTKFLLIAGAVLQSCAAKSNIVGDWDSGAPSHLRFEYRPDGSVWLMTEKVTRQVWRYEVTGNDILTLYDGLGRKREYRFSIQGSTLTFNDVKTGEAVERYTRAKPSSQ